MFVYTTVMYKHMKSLKNDARNLSGNMCEVKYIENFIFIFYIANEGRHARIDVVIHWRLNKKNTKKYKKIQNLSCIIDEVKLINYY